MEKAKTFSLRWTDEEKHVFKKKINKEEIIASLEGLIVGFPRDNGNAKRLVQLIPQVDVIYINIFNKNQIQYIKDSKYHTMHIGEENKVIWAILTAYCKTGKESELFRLEWIRDDQRHEKYLKRAETKQIFDGLIMAYPHMNENSKKISDILPIVDELYINWDYTGDVNSVYYKIDEETVGGIAIKPHNKIVWSKLKEMCTVQNQTD